MSRPNRLLPFAFDHQVAHGAIVQIEEGVADFLAQRPYPADVARLVAECLAAMPLMATHLAFEGRVSLQFQPDPGSPGLQLLVAQVDHRLNVRAMAKVPPGLQGGAFTELLTGGLLALMIEPAREGAPTSQAVVPIEGRDLAEALEGYFLQSEQLPTLVRLAARGERLAGFMLQRLPLQSAKGTQEDWEHLLTLASTLGADELLDTDPYTILRRLFHEDPVRTFEPREVTVACRCNRANISAMLLSLGREEVDSIVAEQGRVAVTCEFCGREQLFMPHDVHELFDAAARSEPDPESERKH